MLMFCRVGNFLIVNFPFKQAMVDVAKACGADAVSHGCTGKGNDQVSCLPYQPHLPLLVESVHN